MIGAIPSFTALNALKSICDKYLGPDVSTIIEFGARYGEDSVELATTFPTAQVFSFECNAKTLPTCRQAIKESPRITLIESAVGEYDGVIKFYPINSEKTITTWSDGNQGASSLFRASGKYEIEQYVQDEVEVPVCKLSTVMHKYGLTKIDLLWMDAQGAELLALRGLEEKIKLVKIIYTEVSFFEIYSGQPDFETIREFLSRRGFQFYDFMHKDEFSGDAIFIRTDIFSQYISKLFEFRDHS